MMGKSPNKSTLCIAIMCHNLVFPAWAAACIEEVMTLPYTKLVLLIKDAKDFAKPISLWNKLLNYHYSRFLYHLYGRFMTKPSAMKSRDLSKLLENLPILNCNVVLKGKHSEYFSDADIRKIASYQPDIILRFGFNIIRGDILTVAKYGVWSFHHSDEQKYRGFPAGFWEIMKGDPITSAILQRLTHKLDSGIVLKKGNFKTINKSFSANIDSILWSTTSWMKQVCIDIHNDTAPYFNDVPSNTTAPIYSFPDNITFLRYMVVRQLNTLAFHYREFFKPEQWNIAVVEKSAHAILKEGLIASEMKWLDQEKRSHFKADPFILGEGETAQLLFEKFDYNTNKGYIGAVSAQNLNNYSNAIAESYHLSYPFIIKHGEFFFCIPSASESGNIVMYQLDKENNHWGNKRVLLEHFNGLDPTLLKHNGRWWLFCTNNAVQSNAALHIFYSNQLQGPYHPHANNPVKYNITSARPAGTPFKIDSVWIRPAQNCVSTYGSKIVFNKIRKLSPIEFEEEQVGELAPSSDWKFSKGLHNISSNGQFTVIDAKRHIFNWANFNHKINIKLKRLGR